MMIFPFVLLMSKTSFPGDETSRNQSVKLIWLTGLFLHAVLLTAFFYSPFKLKLMPSVSNCNDEFRTESSSHLTNNIFLNDY